MRRTVTVSQSLSAMAGRAGPAVRREAPRQLLETRRRDVASSLRRFRCQSRPRPRLPLVDGPGRRALPAARGQCSPGLSEGTAGAVRDVRVATSGPGVCPRGRGGGAVGARRGRGGGAAGLGEGAWMGREGAERTGRAWERGDRVLCAGQGKREEGTRVEEGARVRGYRFTNWVQGKRIRISFSVAELRFCFIPLFCYPASSLELCFLELGSRGAETLGI